MQTIKIIFLALFACSLAIPASIKYLGTSKFLGTNLGGITKTSKKTALSYDNILNASYQKKTEQLFSKSLPIFGPLVRLDNQLSFWLFKQISSNPKSKVVLGKKGQLIERAYLNSFNGGKVPKLSKLTSIADQLFKLKLALEKKGKVLEILISTNKPAYYPELVPAEYRVKDALSKIKTSDLFIHMLKSKGLNPLDSKAYLKSIESESQFPMFAPTGTHWNQFASCKIISEMLSRISVTSSANYPQLSCSIKGIRKKPTEQDMDLLKITNLLFPKALIKPAPLVVFNIDKAEGSIKPRLLIIGTSFSGELMGVFNKNPQLAEREFLYYFKRQIIPGKSISRSFNNNNFDTLAAIERNDAIILEVNEASVQRIGYSFIKKALKALN